MQVRIFAVSLNGEIGYDVQILSPEATIQDYLNGLNLLIEKGELQRSRRQVKDCVGCDGCCAERIPLTNIDLLRLWETPDVGGDSLYGILDRCAHIEVDGPWVDITLAREDSGVCHFFNQENHRCKIYTYRPLVCQTFVCSPATERAQALRSSIVNAGEDELVRLWLLEGMLTGNLPVNKGGAEGIRIGDWEEGPYTGKTKYSRILIKDLCPEPLWLELTAGV